MMLIFTPSNPSTVSCDENHYMMKFGGEFFWSGHDSEEQLSHKLV